MKRFTVIWLILCLLLSSLLTGCQKEDAEGTQTTPPPIQAIQSVDEIPLETLLYLFIDMTDLGLERMMRKPLTQKDIGGIVGNSAFQASFAEGMNLIPTIQPSTFDLAVFRLNPDQDATAFANQLMENANLNKWVCTSAQMANALVSGRTVVFYMCDSSTDVILQDTFKTICTPGFRPEEHLRFPLKDSSAREIYEELFAAHSIERYGFMDGKELGTSGKGLPDGLKLPKVLTKSEMCWDVTEEDATTASLVLVLKGQPTDEEDAKQTAMALYEAAVTVRLSSYPTPPEFRIGYSAEYGVYILYAVTDNWRYFTWDIDMTLQNALRMTLLHIPE